ncbi:MAG: hypothetical protein JNL74_18170, partial [Fibrobacteres bacterium]|nr:hypothetical protein [Fibrobacterota bacterium]
ATAPSAPPKSELERAANERKERELLRASGVDLEEFKDNDYLEGFDDTIKAENAEVNSTNQRKYDGFSKCKGKSYYTPSNDLIGDLNRVYEDTELIKREFVFKSEVKEMLQEAYEKATSIQVSEIKYNPQEYSIHPLFDVTDKETEFEIHPSIKDAGKYSIVSEMIRPIYKIIQNNLARYICDESAAKWSGSLCSGRKLDRKMLPRIPFGEMRFFRDRTKKNARNIVFELVVDLSGSMYGKKIEEARSAAVLFGEVLNSLHIPFEIIGYTSGKRNLNHKISSTDIAIQKCISYNRTDGLVHVMFKRFDESYDNVKYKLMSMNAHGGNYDQDSMEFVWNRIRKRSEKKKVILWLTDSETNGGIEARFKLKKMINKIGQTADSEIIGIGFLSDYVADFYHKYVIVERVEDLGLNIVRLIKSAIYDTKIKTQHARAVA